MKGYYSPFSSKTFCALEPPKAQSLAQQFSFSDGMHASILIALRDFLSDKHTTLRGFCQSIMDAPDGLCVNWWWNGSLGGYQFLGLLWVGSCPRFSN
jgi:hypothetical protein